MPGSYETINYSLRPAKHIERKMICEAFKKLGEFASVSSYRYIGFGSIYFSDFALFHRQLNLSNMVSIEKDEHNKDRFQFNKPYKCIELEYGSSSEVLPRLSWEDRSVVWLDYDGKVDVDVLNDVGAFCAKAIPGSMLIVSVNAHYPPKQDKSTGSRLKELETAVGSEMIPIGLEESDLGGWRASATIRRIISNVIEREILKRNGSRSVESALSWKQVMSFEYADGAKMTTLGGVLVEQGQNGHYLKCSFDDLEFFEDQHSKAYRIEVPSLTYREIRHLDRLLPADPDNQVELVGVPPKDIKRYSKVYRYFPNFSEVDA